MSSASLTPTELYKHTEPDTFGFNTTADVENSTYDIVGQSRALGAIEFGIGMHRDNYNLYVAGSTGLGKHTVIQSVLEEYAIAQPAVSDWCYTDNFDEFYKPLVLQVPAGIGTQLRDDAAHLIDDLLIAVPSTYESDEYRTRAQEIEEAAEERKESAFKALDERAHTQQIGLLNTPTGYSLAPLSNDTPIGQDEFSKLPEDQQQAIEQKIEVLKKELKEIILHLPEWQKETMEQFKELNTEFAKATVEQFLRALFEKYAGLPQVIAYLKKVRKDIVQNMHYFMQPNPGTSLLEGQSVPIPPELGRYEINVLVNNKGVKGAPIIYENNPTYNNLIGRIEHIAQEGALVTDFTLIKPGALHRANGGYLILDMHKLLLEPFAWEGLKRVLHAGNVRMESLERLFSLVSTVTLEPEPIPLNVKVILLGDRYLYYLLKAYDPEFNQLFKVTADFSESFDRTDDATRQLAHLISTIVKREKVLPVRKDGVARMIEHCARETGDAEKLSLHMGLLKDLVLEADYWAAKAQQNEIAAEHVQQAIDAQHHRASQIHEQIKEQITRGIVLIDTQGVCSGQINGLSVFEFGDYNFGQPSRITATARLGNGNVLDIERETKLGGPIHSKGVIILSSCFAHRYARNFPLSLTATLVFEQNYGGVDGDSASIAEYCALVSALTDIPVKQSLAVTGSINQHGVVQAIGGVNEKIEGFFDICKTRGLTGEQGVIIPVANAKDLMLHQSVVQAVAHQQFQVHTVETVDDALELLLGMPIGVADAVDHYPEGTINFCVMQRLEELHELHKRFAKSISDEDANATGVKDDGQDDD